MRILTTIILAILCAMGWMSWRWIQAADATAPPPVGKPLVRFESADLRGIQLRRTEISANLKPIDGVWHFTSPILDRVDPTAALAIYLGLNGLVLHDSIPWEELREDDRQLEEFGLGRKAVRLRLMDRDNKTLHDFRIGDVTPWLKDGEPTMYFQWNNGPVPKDVLIVGGNLRALLDRPFDALRARNALHLPRPPVAISITRGQERLDLHRDNPSKPWHITRPIQERANTAAIDGLLRALSTTEASALIPWDQSPLPGQEHTRLTITMADADNPGNPPPAPGTPVNRQSGTGRIDAVFHALPTTNGAPTVVSRWSDRSFDLVLPASTLDLLAPAPNRFRADTLADFDAASITSIVIRDPASTGEPAALQRAPHGWEVFLRDQWLPADPLKIEKAIAAISACPIQDFPTDSLNNPAAFGLDQPALQLALEDQSGQRHLLDLARAHGKFHAHFAGSSSVYQIADAILTFLPPRAAAWRSRQLFSFSTIDIRQIVLTSPVHPEIALRYNPDQNLWVAMENGADRTNALDTALAANLAANLERLTAARWLSESTGEAAAALATPTHQIQITTATVLDDGSPGPDRKFILSLAPATQGSPFLYGKFNGEPDVFLIKRELVDSLAESLFAPGAE